MPFTMEIDEDEPLENYNIVKVDGKAFYQLKTEEQPVLTKRYSEKLKDPHSKAIDTYRRLSHLLHAYGGNTLQARTEKYKEAIEAAIWILQKDANIEACIIFKHFALAKYGFKAEEYGVCEENDAEPEDSE